MGRKEKISSKEKITVVKEYQNGNKTLRDIADSLGVHHSSVEKWITLYKTFGEEGLYNNKHNQKYSPAMKREAVQCYLMSGRTLHDVCQKYGLRSLSQLQYWIKQYQQKELKTTVSI